MSYFSKLKAIGSYFYKSFRYDYEPPNSHCEPPISLLNAIRDCSNQGKLLILNLTLNNKRIEVPLEFPEEDYIIYTAPFNSKNTFNLASTFQIDTIPFVGLFFCRTKNPSDVQLIDKIVDVEDFLRVGNHFRRLSRELYERRDKYIINEESRNIINDQDLQYEEVLREAQLKDEKEKERIQHEEQVEEKKKQKVQHALKRFNSLPPPPTSGKNTISVKFMLSGKPAKVREFDSSDSVSLLFDYVSVDYAPAQPSISYGYPKRTISANDLGKTFSELNFAKKETVFVESDDEEEEEEDNC